MGVEGMEANAMGGGSETLPMVHNLAIVSSIASPTQMASEPIDHPLPL